MKAINTLIMALGLLTSGLALAHGGHAAAPADSLLHLLVHNWPLLLGLAGISGSWLAWHRTR